MTKRTCTVLEKSVLCPIMTTTKEVVEVVDRSTGTKTKVHLVSPVSSPT